ncbi:MAG: hypothetical protein IT556_03575 [Acetobacteraceae bacterium]|nr:hypothetical protein [Acetobacteraceae bacterium]
MPRASGGGVEGIFRPFAIADMAELATACGLAPVSDRRAELAIAALNKWADWWPTWRLAGGAPARQRAEWLARVVTAADVLQDALGLPRGDADGELGWDARQHLRSGRASDDLWLEHLVRETGGASPIDAALRLDEALHHAASGIHLIRYLATGGQQHLSAAAGRAGPRVKEGRHLVIYGAALAFALAFRTRAVAGKDVRRDGASPFARFAAAVAKMLAERLPPFVERDDLRAVADLRSVTEATVPGLLHGLRAQRRANNRRRTSGE